MEFLNQHPTETVFVITLLIYGTTLAIVSYWYSKSQDQRTAHENLPKTIKHITEGFVSIVVFLLLFYLAVNGLIPKDVLITLISVFATAGFLSIKGK